MNDDVNKARCWVQYDPAAVIGEFGWLWQLLADGRFCWTLIMTIEDRLPASGDSDLVTITLDDSQPPRRASACAGLPYLPCLAPSICQGESDRMEVVVRLPDGASAAHAFGAGKTADRIDAALRAILNFGERSTAAIDVLAERRRQVEGEGWTADHDDAHDYAVLARAGACYAMDALSDWHVGVPGEWPFEARWWKPTTARRDLVKAAALIMAEIEKLDREGQQA